MNRRQALIAALGSAVLPFRFGKSAGACLTPVGVNNSSDTEVQTLFQKELPDLQKGDNTVSLSVLRVQYAPGAESRPHSHPVPVFVYILRGSIESQVEGERARRYLAGEFFFEEARGKHLVARNASSTEPAEFLAVFVGNAKLPLASPLSAEDGSRP